MYQVVSQIIIISNCLENLCFYTVTCMYWSFVINLGVFASLLKSVMKHFISILTDFMISHKITFYSKCYDIHLLEICTHDGTYISLYVY